MLTVSGGHGELTLDTNGLVVVRSTAEAYLEVHRVDLAEYELWLDGAPGRRAWRTGKIDILAVGFWTPEGDYVEPDHTYRLWSERNRNG